MNISVGKCSGPIRSESELKSFINQNERGISAVVESVCFGSSEVAREVVQELYPRLLRMLNDRCEGLREPWACVRTVAKRLAVDEHRKRVRLRETASLPDLDTLVLQRDEGELRFAVQDQLDFALARIEPRLREIISAVYLEERKAKDVAKSIGLSESRFSEVKQEALTKLRTVLVS